MVVIYVTFYHSLLNWLSRWFEIVSSHKVDNPYFEGMVNRIYPPELQLNKANYLWYRNPIFGFAFIYFKRICFI